VAHSEHLVKTESHRRVTMRKILVVAIAAARLAAAQSAPARPAEIIGVGNSSIWFQCREVARVLSQRLGMDLQQAPGHRLKNLPRRGLTSLRPNRESVQAAVLSMRARLVPVADARGARRWKDIDASFARGIRTGSGEP